jgi:hypothetical protein
MKCVNECVKIADMDTSKAWRELSPTQRERVLMELR